MVAVSCPVAEMRNSKAERGGGLGIEARKVVVK